MDVQNIASHFKGNFITPWEAIAEKLEGIKAFVFDWDGVFNNGMKDEKGSSPFSEVDSMGTNLLRFNHYLLNGHNPVFAVISGEHNKAAASLAKREHFHALYSGIRFKVDALKHLCKAYDIQPSEVAFFFDDVLDLSVAAQCGLRIMIPRPCNPLLVEYAIQHNMVDYLTACEGGNGAVREAVELLTGLGGRYAEVLTQRMNFTETYQAYLAERNEIPTAFYTIQQSTITEDQNI
jgi:3-deoxy-D-manno-octulosonate 8-phosphate phosphatase (KDO 8-P phosphatase)